MYSFLCLIIREYIGKFLRVGLRNYVKLINFDFRRLYVEEDSIIVI